MQHYLAITAPELLAPTPPARRPIVVASEELPEGVSWEEAIDEAQDEAAWQSLLLARDENTHPARIVLGGRLSTADSAFDSWEQVEDIYADDEESQAICAAALAAQTQDEADRLVSDLVERPLLWFDVSEREELGASLG